MSWSAGCDRRRRRRGARAPRRLRLAGRDRLPAPEDAARPAALRQFCRRVSDAARCRREHRRRRGQRAGRENPDPRGGDAAQRRGAGACERPRAAAAGRRPVTVLVALVLVLAAVAGTGVVLTRNPLRQAFALAANGMALSLLFIVLRAPDVAYSEIAVNTVAVPLMFLALLVSLRTDRPKPK